MDSIVIYLALALALVVAVGVGVALLLSRRGEPKAPPRPGIDYAPGVGDDDSVPRDTPRRAVEEPVGPEVLGSTEVLEEPTAEEL